MNDRKEGVGPVFRAVTIAVIPGVAFLAVYGVGRQLWMDDTHSTYHAFSGLGGVIDSLRTDSHPPLFFWFLSLWMKLGGNGEIWLRIPSIVFTVSGGLVLFLFGREEDDPRLRWMYLLFFLFNPIVVWHMHTVRPYALAGLLAAISTTLLLRLVSPEGAERNALWALFLLVNALGTLTLYWFFLLLSAQAIGALLFLGRRSGFRLVLALGGSVVPFAVLWAPVFLEQLQGAPTSWMTVPGWAWILRAPLDLIGGTFPFFFQVPALGFYLLLALSLLIRVRPPSDLGRLDAVKSFLRDRRIRLLLSIPFTVMVLALAWSQLRPVYDPKYTIVVSPALAVLLGFALARLSDRLLVPLICAFFLISSMAVRDTGLRLERSRDNRAVTRYIVENYREGDELVNVSLGYAPTIHYLRALAPHESFSTEVFPAEVGRHPGWRDREGLLEDTLSLRREARQLVGRLSARRGVERVWFLPDFVFDGPISEILLEELDRAFVLDEVVPLEGWWVSEIRIYSVTGNERHTGGMLAGGVMSTGRSRLESPGPLRRRS